MPITKETSRSDDMLGLELRRLLDGLEPASSLAEPDPREPDQLRKRIDLLDLLDLLDEPDAVCASADSQPFGNDSSRAQMQARAQAVRGRLEAVNAELYQSIRDEIRRGALLGTILPWIQATTCRSEMPHPARGPAFDYLDDLVSGILQLREPSTGNMYRHSEMIRYQPTPVRHILQLITGSAISATDVLIDLGSGLGHVPILACMLTGVRSVGIEVETSYVETAQKCATRLGLSQVRFLRQDVREADFSSGTVFYLYSPFTGSILTHVLARLRTESECRPIRVVTFGPCTSIVAEERWLRASAPPLTDRVTLFEPRF